MTISHQHLSAGLTHDTRFHTQSPNVLSTNLASSLKRVLEQWSYLLMEAFQSLPSPTTPSPPGVE